MEVLGVEDCVKRVLKFSYGLNGLWDIKRWEYGRGLGTVGGALSREAIARQIHPPGVGAERNEESFDYSKILSSEQFPLLDI